MGVFTEGGRELFGLDADVYLKKQAKRDIQFESELIGWLEKVTNRPLSIPSDVRLSLRDGTHLCQLLNSAIRPQFVKFVARPAPGVGEMDNLRVFLLGCTKIGVNPTALFDPNDLMEGNDMGQVMMCLADVARIVQRRSGYQGPFININSPSSTKLSPHSPATDSENHSPLVIHIDTTTTTPTKKWAPVKINDGFRGGVMTRDQTPATLPASPPSPLPQKVIVADDDDNDDERHHSSSSSCPSSPSSSSCSSSAVASTGVHRRTGEAPTVKTPLIPPPDEEGKKGCCGSCVIL